MPMCNVPTTGCIVLATLSILVGCQQGTAPVPLPEFDPATVGQAAVEQYDANRDAALGGAELDNVPGIKQSLENYDINRDEKVSADEIATRLQQALDHKLGICPPFGCRVALNGQPLPDAVVRFVPEPFLGGTTMTAMGVTDQRGIARVQVPQRDLSAELKGIRGIQPGIYRVEITHSRIELPARYNRQSILGQEISNESILLRADDTVYRLTIKE
jgi:hypothetical protein